jgi:hypothetical protein
MPAIGAVEIFVFRQGQFVGSRMFSPDRVVSIGRALDQGLRLDDEEVSSRHATLRVVDGRLVIADAGSRNGVYVNGRKVQSAKVSSFDEILVGGCRLKIDIVGGQQEEAADSVEKTRVGPTPTGPGSPATAPPRSAATSTFVPRMADEAADAALSGPTTAQFMRKVPSGEPEPPAPPPPRHVAAPAAPVHVAPPPPPPAPPAPAAPPHVGGRTVAFPGAMHTPHAASAAPPSFVDEDARTASIEFAPPAAPAPGAGGTYWDFDEEPATQPGRAQRERAPHEEPQDSHLTRPLPGLDGSGASADLVIVDPQAATAPAEVVTTPRTPAVAPPRPQPYPMVAAPPAPEPPMPAPSRRRTPMPRAVEAAPVAPPQGLSTATV